MACLEELTPGAFIKGLLPDRLVTVVNAKWYGSTGVELTFKDAAGRPGSVLLYRDREPALEIVSTLHPWSFDADGEVLRLVSEAYRIHFAYSVDVQATDPVAVGSGKEYGAEREILSPGFVREQLILEERALARQAAGTARERETWGNREETRSRGVETFFVEAINLLDGQISLREPGRYEITQLPASLADLGGSSSFNKQDLKRYNYFTFDVDKTSLPNKPAAELILPGHPLIKATVQLVLEHYQSVLRQGAILVDPGDDGEELRALFYLEHLVEEVGDSDSLNAVISRQLQYVSIDAHGQVQMAGKAPDLNYQPLSEEDLGLVETLRDEPWICAGLEDKVLEFAVSEIVPRHLEQVRHHQKELTARAMAVVRNRVREEIRTRKERVDQSSSQGPAASPSMDEFESQLQQHMQDLEEKRQIFPLSPVAIGGALVVPAGLLAQLKTWYRGDRKEIIADVGSENADLENASQPPQPSVFQDDIEHLMPEIAGQGQEIAADQDEPLAPVAKDSGAEIQWREIIEHIQQEEKQETLDRQEDQQEELPLEEYQGNDGSALFSLVPDLVPARDSGAEQPGRETMGVRPYGLSKKHFTGIPVDLQKEWQAHAQRLRELDLEIPKDVALIKRNDLDGSLAVWIPSGKFLMGAKKGSKDEKPVHSVQVDGFYMDICLVTNAQYAKFAEATGLQDWKPPVGYADHPVVGVNWGNAKAYCEWVGKRLPTEAEWEKVARGTDGRDYPWGQNYKIGNANALRAGYKSTSPVGIFPSGQSPFGALDMAGNVWEWVADWYEASYYLRGNSNNPEGPERGEHRVVRGGAWICHANYLRCTKRDHHPEAYQSRFIGFRCVH